MSALQIGLVLLGALVLAAIVAQGLWQARRHEVRQPARTAAPREEPGLAPPPGDAAEPPLPVAADEPTLGTMEARVEPVLPRRTPPSSLRLDALIDAIATLSVDSPVAGESALMHLPPSRRAGSKPLRVEGLNAETGDWELPAAGQRYGEFQAGVQLANRAGALNEIEYSEFVQKVQAFADGIGAAPDFPDMLDVVGRARELDLFAGAHDAQLALRLVSRGAAWSIGYVQQHAGRHGFVSGTLPGRLVLPAAEEGAPPVLSLQFDSQAALADEPSQAVLQELTLAFDVPQTAQAEAPFTAWCAAGEALALALDATLYDDGGQLLQPAAFGTIGTELERLYAALAERDLAAGSAAARRLFS